MSKEWLSLGSVIIKYLVLAVIFSIILEMLIHFVKSLLPKKYRKKRNQNHAAGTDSSAVKNPNAVIRAEHVCLDFDKSIDEYSSLKELLIQKIKRKKEKGKFRALDDISFEIEKGDVVGIIGTNGAGKSTLLRIVSGAYAPTSGTMSVDSKQVQMLTLGTGFDTELTGKENVYLNGAIIGYDKSFLKEHYDEIVEFAELEGFMDEKMKKYSSGMISRLGFAVATAGNAAEILILDEVLSVGDRLFARKSLNKITELIHSGSTVIMVSHSTETIRENCNKAMWIEKGKMIAYGLVDEVCDLYEQYDGKTIPDQIRQVKEA